MFVKNSSAEQKKIFTLEDEIDKRLNQNAKQLFKYLKGCVMFRGIVKLKSIIFMGRNAKDVFTWVSKNI